MLLENLDEFAQQFITVIVDSYVKGYKYMSDGTNPYIDKPGTTVENLLSGIFDKNFLYHIHLKNDNGNIKIVFLIKKEAVNSKSENSDESHKKLRQYVKTKQADVLYKITLLKWLHDSGYILLIDNNSYNSFNSLITDKDKEKWKSAELIYREKTIYSELIYNFISKFYSSIIIPSPQLIEFREHDFKTIEKRRFEKSLQTAWVAIFVAIGIALASPFLMSKCSSTTVEQKQIESIIKAIPKPVEEIKIDDAQMDSLIKTINQVISKTDTTKGNVDNKRNTNIAK